jgi:predicted GNAT family N-acyltransferase
MTNLQLKIETHSDLEQIVIADARSEKERQAIYRFRYGVHVGELSRSISGADHRRKRIIDPLDSWSQLIYAKSNNQVIGTARITIGRIKKFPNELTQVLQMDRFEDFDSGSKTISLVTKLIVDPRYRKTPVSFRLMARCYEMVREHHSQFSFGGCSPYLIPMYEQLGYRRFADGFQDPGYGFVIPILLLPEDVVHLTAVRSPFMRVARRLDNSPASREWFLGNIYDSDKYPVSLLTSDQERWDFIAHRLGDPFVALAVLQDLSPDEARKFLQIGTPFDCHSGQQFIRQGDVCNELNILISGEMDITDSGNRTWRAGPGDIVGSVGLSETVHHRVDITAVSNCQIMAISRFPFEKLLRGHPGLAEKLSLNNLGRED